MAAVADLATGTATPPPIAVARRRERPQVWRWILLTVVGLYFAIPLFAAFKFAGGKAFTQVFSQAGFSDAFLLSLRLALITTVITIVLLVPTTVYVHLRLPGIRRAMETVTILPIVIPPIVLIVGVLEISPSFLRASANLLGLEYVVLAMPFAYRSLDAGLRSLDLKTLVEASGSLGARMPVTLWRVILPNLRTAMLSAVVLTVALVLGEFTMASLDLYQTFPVWIVNFEQSSGPVSVAASLLALIVTWIFLMIIATLGNRRGKSGGGANLFSVSRNSGNTGGSE